jgi:hypothetical protein
MTCVGCEVLTGCAAAGTSAVPEGLPGDGRGGTGAGWVAAGVGDGLGVGDGVGEPLGLGRALCRGCAGLSALTFPEAVPQAARARAAATDVTSTPKLPIPRMAPHSRPQQARQPVTPAEKSQREPGTCRTRH